LSGRRILVDWTDSTYSRAGENAFFEFFDSDLVADLPIPATDDVAPAIWKDRIGRSVIDLTNAFFPDRHASLTIHRKFSIDPRRRDYPHDLVVYWTYIHQLPLMRRALARTPGWSTASDRDVIRRVLSRHMPLKAAIRARIDDFVAADWRKPMIGVHVRHSDLKVGLADVTSPLEMLLKRHPDAGLFVATDNRAMLDTLSNRYPNVVSTPKWYPGGDRPMHYNDECPDVRENGIGALVDMGLLSRCDHLIYPSASTFSWISAMLSEAPPANIVDVQRRHPVVRLKRYLRTHLP
jgi:hypothetical protein